MNVDQRQLLSQLSPRQLQVIKLVSLHKSSKEIARELGISPATVDSHVATIVDRLGASSRRDAIAILQLQSQAMPAIGDPHGGDSLAHRPPWYSSLRLTRKGPALTGGSPPDDDAHAGLGSVLFRFVLDAFFVVVFFSIMSAAAYGVHEVVHLCEANNVDQIVVNILKGVSYALVTLDGVGVVSATGILTFRFVQAILKVGK